MKEKEGCRYIYRTHDVSSNFLTENNSRSPHDTRQFSWPSNFVKGLFFVLFFNYTLFYSFFPMSGPQQEVYMLI